MPVTLADRMRHTYGNGPEGETCGNCKYFERLQFPKRVIFKCRFWLAVTGMKSSSASDWRLKWPACAKFARRCIMSVRCMMSS